MKNLGKTQIWFPENTEEYAKWEETRRWIALHSQVLVFAHTRPEGAWCAYCFPVPGEDHQQELSRWRKHGSKLLEEWARPLFPIFDGIPYAR